MRGKVNYGISGNYVINGVRRECVVDDDSISKGEFVNAHHEPDAYKYLTGDKIIQFHESFFELSDGNYLYSYGGSLYIYNVKNDTLTAAKVNGKQLSSAGFRTLTRLGDDGDTFMYFVYEVDYISASSVYKLFARVYILHYDATDMSVSVSKLLDEYITGNASNVFVHHNESNAIFISGETVLIVTRYVENNNSLLFYVRSYSLKGTDYTNYSLTYQSRRGYSTEYSSEFTYAYIANDKYIGVITYRNARTTSISENVTSLDVYDYSAGSVGSNYSYNSTETGYCMFPISISDTTIYGILADASLNLYLAHISIASKTGGKTSLGVKLKGSTYYFSESVAINTVSKLGSIVTIDDSTGVRKRAFFGDGWHDEFKKVYTYQMDPKKTAIDYQGEYQDNFLIFEVGAANNTDANQNIVWSKKIVNHEMIDTTPGKFRVISGKDAKHITGVANESGVKGDTIECILSEYVKAEDK